MRRCKLSISIPCVLDTTILKNIRIAGRRTSMKLESFEWQSLERICATEGISVDEFCERADRDPARTESSRTGRIQVAIMNYFMTKAEGRPGELPSGVSDASL